MPASATLSIRSLLSVKENLAEKIYFSSVAVTAIVGVILGMAFAPLVAGNFYRSIAATAAAVFCIGVIISFFSAWKKIPLSGILLMNLPLVILMVSGIAAFSDLVGCVPSLIFMLIFFSSLISGSFLSWKLSGVLFR